MRESVEMAFNSPAEIVLGSLDAVADRYVAGVKFPFRILFTSVEVTSMLVWAWASAPVTNRRVTNKIVFMGNCFGLGVKKMELGC